MCRRGRRGVEIRLGFGLGVWIGSDGALDLLDIYPYLAYISDYLGRHFSSVCILGLETIGQWHRIVLESKIGLGLHGSL